MDLFEDIFPIKPWWFSIANVTCYMFTGGFGIFVTLPTIGSPGKKKPWPSPPRKSHQSETGKGESSWKLRASILDSQKSSISLSKLTNPGTGGGLPPSSFFKSWPFDPPSWRSRFHPYKGHGYGSNEVTLKNLVEIFHAKVSAWICFGLISIGKRWKSTDLSPNGGLIRKKMEKNSFKQSQVCQSYCVHSGVLGPGNYYLVTPKKNISTESDLQSLLLKNPKFS